MSQGDDGGAGVGRGSSIGSGHRPGLSTGGNGNLMSLIRERQGAAGSTQILDLSYADLDSFPTEIEFLRDVLEKLTMSHNSIRTLPLQLNMFTSLRYLNIRANSIRIFPAVLCHLSSLEILDMSRNKISRFPDNFGNLMNLRVLSISRNRIEAIPTYVGDMAQLQFLKIEQNPLAFPPPEIVDFPGQDMERWLNHLKSFLLSHKKEHEAQVMRMQGEEAGITAAHDITSVIQQRSVRSASLDSLAVSPPRRHSKSESGLRLSIPNGAERGHPSAISLDPIAHKMTRSGSHQGSREEDHYRFISHSRGISGDSTSSFGSSTSNDCDKYSEVYFQRLATYPPPSHPLPGERMRLVEAARGILFALSQIYRAVKQVVVCSTDEKFSLMFAGLLQSASSAMAQLIQSLDRFDSSAQVQVPDQTLCSEVMRCCESNVVAFRKLVHMVQAQIKSISISADARLVRNLVLMLHGALSEIRVAWDSLLPLLRGPEVGVEIVESGQQLQQQQAGQQAVMITPLSQSQHHQQSFHLPASLSTSHQPHPFQLSPTMPSSSTWLPIQIPQRSQNMSRTSNHSAQSTSNLQQEEEEDAQLLLTVEHATEAARRVIQCLSETCMTRVENLLASPQQRPVHRARSVSASPPRSVGSNGSSSGDPSGKSLSQSMSPLQLAADTSGPVAIQSSLAMASSVNNSSSSSQGGNNKTDGGLIRSPLFSPASDTVPYSNGMCVALPIDQSSTVDSAAAGPGVHYGQGDDSASRFERRPGTHSKGSSKTSFDPALPSIPQDEDHEINAQSLAATGASTPQYQPVMTSRSASVSGLPSGTHNSTPTNGAALAVASSLPSQGFMCTNSTHPQVPLSYQQPNGSGFYPPAPSFPFSSGGLAPLPASQLWREMKDCLLQMTEIVKRLDLDLTMLRTDDHSQYPYQQGHPHQLQQGQFLPHSQMHLQSQASPHPHQPQPHGPNPYQQLVQLAHSSDETSILRRRFGMGVSDFVKSVVVISTLVRQLSTSSSSTTRSGSGPTTTGDTTSRTMAATSSSALSGSPFAPRTRSGSGVDISNLSTPTAAAASLSLSSSLCATEVSPTFTAPTPSTTSMSASSSASGVALIASPEKPGQPQQQQQQNRQNYNQLSKYPQQQQQQQPEIFSRLVMTNVSNLTKITKELTVRMPRSTFRDYLLSPSSAGGGGGGGGGVGPGVGPGTIGGSNGGHGSYGFGYGPAGASILAMRKGSLT